MKAALGKSAAIAKLGRIEFDGIVAWLAWSRAPGESPSVREPQTG